MTDLEANSGRPDADKETASSEKQGGKPLRTRLPVRPSHECEERLCILCITGEPMADAVARAEDCGLQATFVPADVLTTTVVDDRTLREWMKERYWLFTEDELLEQMKTSSSDTAEGAAVFDYCWTKLGYKSRILYTFRNYRFLEESKSWAVDHAPLQRWAVEVPVDIWDTIYERVYSSSGDYKGIREKHVPPFATWSDRDWDKLAFALSRQTLTTDPAPRIAKLPEATGPKIELKGDAFCARFQMAFRDELPGGEQKRLAQAEITRIDGVRDSERRIPHGFFFADGSIYTRIGCKKNDPPVRISRHFVVSTAARDSEGKGWGKILAFKDHEGAWRELFVSDALHHKSVDLFQLLADSGFDVEPAAASKVHLVALLSKWRPRETVNRVNVPGWQDDGVFVGPMGDVVGTTGLGDQHWISRPPEWTAKKGGSLRGWQDGALSAFSGQTPQLAIGIGLGLAGPVLHHLELSNRGLFFSGKTSGGKSSAQIAQVSVWSDPRLGRGLRNSARATANGLEFLLSCASGTTAAIDDTGNGGVDLVQEAVFMAAEGRGKARLNQAAEAKLIRSWRGMTFSISGELTPSQVMAATRSDGLEVAGAGVRCPVIDFAKIEQTDREAFGHIMQSLTENYGWAGPLMVEAIQKFDQSSVRSVFEGCLAQLREAGDDTPQVRTAEGLAAIWTACLIARDSCILPRELDSHDIGDVITEIWANIRSNFEFERLNVEEAASDRLMAWLQTSGEVFELGAQVPVGRTALAWRDPMDKALDENGYGDGPWIFYLPRDSLSRIKLGTTPAAAIEALRKSGRLIPRKGETNGTAWTHPYIPGGVGRVRHYRIALSAADFGLLPEQHG